MEHRCEHWWPTRSGRTECYREATAQEDGHWYCDLHLPSNPEARRAAFARSGQLEEELYQVRADVEILIREVGEAYLYPVSRHCPETINLREKRKEYVRLQARLAELKEKING
jgi:hypothetical protein